MADIKKVYLDTSVISALFDSRTPERQKLTQVAWKNLIDHDVYISEKVFNEINRIKDSQGQLRENHLKVVSGFTILPVTEEALKLAGRYITEGIFPQKYYADVLHVALASVNGISYLLSWNFSHLVKVKTRRLVALVNAVKEYPPVEIIAPPEL